MARDAGSESRKEKRGSLSALREHLARRSHTLYTLSCLSPPIGSVSLREERKKRKTLSEHERADDRGGRALCDLISLLCVRGSWWSEKEKRKRDPIESASSRSLLFHYLTPHDRGEEEPCTLTREITSYPSSSGSGRSRRPTKKKERRGNLLPTGITAPYPLLPAAGDGSREGSAEAHRLKALFQRGLHSEADRRPRKDEIRGGGRKEKTRVGERSLYWLFFIGSFMGRPARGRRRKGKRKGTYMKPEVTAPWRPDSRPDNFRRCGELRGGKKKEVHARSTVERLEYH